MMLEMATYLKWKGSLSRQKTGNPQLLRRLVPLRCQWMVVPCLSKEVKVRVDPGNHNVVQADDIYLIVRIQSANLFQVAEGHVEIARD